MFPENLRRLRLKADLTQEQLAEKLGYAKSTISMYENGKRTPGIEDLEVIADFFNVTLDSLRGNKPKKELLVDLSKLGFEPLPRTVRVPRLGQISCGDPIDSAENFDGFDDVPEHFHADFTLKAEGDSMIGARIRDGDIVYIRQQQTVETGQIAAVLIDGSEKLLKRVYLSADSIVLQAENPAYPPRVFAGAEMNRVSIIGRAVGFASTIK